MIKRTVVRPNDDLFRVFPDLPWPKISGPGEQTVRLRLRIAEMRARATANIARQKAATERVRARVEARLRRYRDR